MPIIHSNRRQQRQQHDFPRFLVVFRLLLIVNVLSKSMAFSSIAVVEKKHRPILFQHHRATSHRRHRFEVSPLYRSTNSNDTELNIKSTISSSSNKDNNKKVTGITLKIAIDAVTGGVADLAEVKSDRFTCPEALDMVHRLRRDCHAVLVGRGTVVADNPSLTLRRGFDVVDQHPDNDDSSKNLHPLRVILDPGLSLLLDRFNEGRLYQVFQDGFPTVVYHCVRDVDEDSLNLLPSVTLVQLSPSEIIKKPLFSADTKNKDNDSGEHRPPPSSTKELTATTTERVTTTVVEEVVTPLTSIQMSVEQVWSDLSRRFDVKHLMVEGGPTTARAFLEAGLVDRVILVQANVGFQKPLLSNLSKETFLKAGLVLQGTDTLGVDQVQYWTRPNTTWPSAKLNEWP